jgi:hypothetical protein
MSGALAATVGVVAADAATLPTVNLKVLLIGGTTTAAWQSALSGEGVPYTLVTPTGAYGAETMTLPALSSGTTANFNAVVFADSPDAFPATQLTTLYAFEAQFQIRQIDGYTYPRPSSGLTLATPCGAMDGSTATLNASGLTGLPALKGPVPMDTGTYGCDATVTAGVPFTTWMTDAAGNELAGVYVHPNTDAQAGVPELEIGFDYLPSSLQWLLLAPGLINWVTQDTHVGLYRNYFGQDIDDNFIADNEWSSAYQCTPAATDPIDFGCPAGVGGNVADGPPDVQMSAADVAYVVAWEQQTGIRLNLAFNGVGACVATAASNAVCNGAITEGGVTYTDPGFVADTSAPNDAALVNALLANQAAFNWTVHTWSHEFLGCIVWQPQPLTSVVANATGGTFTAGTYSYEITAATAYGESEPSTAFSATVGATGSVTLTWPDAPNGSGTTGNAGPTLWQEEAIHSGGTGFWGYNVYRENPGTTTYGYIGHTAENPTGATTTYTYIDNGLTAPGATPGAAAGEPTATNPGIDCANGTSSWDPANDVAGTTDASIDTEIAWDQAWAKANGLTNYSPSVVITGEHSGIDNPNMPAALANVGVNVFATDASRQPQQYSLTSGANVAESAPRYPSNIYYNASNWTDELNEYNTLYLANGTSMGTGNPAGETGRCVDTGSTTCLTAPATEATVLASESRIMLSHVLNNDPRVGYAHQTNLIGPATQVVSGVTVDDGYTLLSLLNNMLSQYNSWTSTPLVQVNDATDASTLQLQSAWATAGATNKVTASETNGVVTVTNTTGATVNVPITAPMGTTINGAAFGESYGGTKSAWTNVTSSGVTLKASSELTAGEQLTLNQSIFSPNGQYRLTMQSDGNLVDYNPSNSPVWASNSVNSSVSYVTMQSDGNLVIYNSSGNPLWASNTAGNTGAYLSLSDTGTIMIFSASGIPLWGAPGILVPGAQLIANQSITTGQYHLTMQPDGNLVVYNSSGSPLWASNTVNASVTHLTMQPDGNLVIYNSTGNPLWASNTAGNTGAYLTLSETGTLMIDSESGVPIWGAPGILVPGAQLNANQSITNGQDRLTMQPDGNLVVYNASNSPLWASNTVNASVTHLTMQPDGNLVIYNSTGNPLWASNTAGNTGAYLTLSNTGTLMIDSESGVPIWGAPGILVSGGQLNASQSITNGQDRLTMQPDGNLVVYNASNSPLWASNTVNTSVTHVTMQVDGNLVIYNSTGNPLWASNTSGNPGAYLTLSNAGVVKVVSSIGVTLWTS